MSNLSGCATAGAQDKVYHTLEILVDKSVGKAFNIKYTYGEEFIDYIKPSAGSVTPFSSYTAPMRIPDEFKISWETQDRQKHEARVPVLSKLPDSVKNQTILFVIMPDHVEGFVAVSTPSGPRKTRFY